MHWKRNGCVCILYTSTMYFVWLVNINLFCSLQVNAFIRTMIQWIRNNNTHTRATEHRRSRYMIDLLKLISLSTCMYGIKWIHKNVKREKTLDKLLMGWLPSGSFCELNIVSDDNIEVYRCRTNLVWASSMYNLQCYSVNICNVIMYPFLCVRSVFIRQMSEWECERRK